MSRVHLIQLRHAPPLFTLTRRCRVRLSGCLADGLRDERIEVRAAGAKRTRILRRFTNTFNKALPMAVGVFAVTTAFATDVVPKRSDFSRYQAMLDHSPFAVATAAALPVATPSFARDLYIANAAKATGEDLVTLNSASDKNFKEYLSTKAPNEHGYGIANIEWSDRVGATKVTISKDGQFATVTFNQALLAVTPGAGGAPGFTQPQQPQPMPQPQMPNATVYTPGQLPAPAQIGRPAVPGVATPPPRVRGVIPRNPTAVNPPVPNVVATPPPLPPNNNNNNNGDDE
jgi:hypothetical protein